MTDIKSIGMIKPPVLGDARPNTPIQGNAFKDTLGDLLGGVNDAILESGRGAEKMASGEVTDLHQVMIAAEKASVGLELVIEIRNKLLEAYQEIMRTQV